MDPKQAQALVGHPCHTAAMKGCLRFVKYFIENGYFELTDINNFGLNIAQSAIAGGSSEILKYLIEERGFDPMSIDYSGMDPLEFLRDPGKEKCRNYLMQTQYVNAHSKHNDGHIPPVLTSEVFEQDMPLFSQGQLHVSLLFCNLSCIPPV